MLEYIFKAFLLTSLVGTALTLLLTAIKPITRKFLSSKWHYYLWLIVLVAMIVPFRFTEPYINDLLSMGIVKGDGTGNFNPDANLTRGDASVMIRNAIKFITGK